MEANSTNLRKYNFINNQPLGEDLFENKSQEKIANVIGEKIINEPDFKIIGIDGEWGSGKSNLVKLIEKKLEKTHKFFVYDVWGHQEDEQRKSILVELTEFIKKEESLLKNRKKDDWDKKLKKLLAKSKTTTTINQPYLSVGFIFSLLSIIYIPSVNVFKDSMVDFFEIESWFWKLLLVTFPIFIVIGIYLWNLVKYWYRKDGFCKSFKSSAQETFQVYTNKQKEETKIETVSEDQPSVREFQNWMQEINDDLNKPIVIVFDNFDRLPKQHILGIWSSIHIFFAEKNYPKIKTIIPFDREHIQNAFKDLNGQDKNFGDDYVNKTFDIVFRVTNPIMSDWKKFFAEQWKKAFVDTDENELKSVIQVYEFLNRRVTPREIIAFINEVLTIKLLDDKFKERYIAIFVLRKDEILKNPLKAVTDYKDILNGLYYVYADDSEYAKQLTAIIYHIDVDEALELIYAQQLKNSMNKNDVELFNKICEADFINAWFYRTLLSLETFENPILTLSKISEKSKIDSEEIKKAWKFFYKVSNVNIPMGVMKVNDWQIALLQNISDNEYLSRLLENYFNLINDNDIQKYIDLLDKLIELLGEERILNNLSNDKISANYFVELIEYKGEDYKKYKLSTNSDELDKYLSELDIEDILKLKSTKYLPKNFEFKQYKEKLKNDLKINANQNKIEVSEAILIKLKETTRKSGELKNLLKDSDIYTLCVNNRNSKLPIINELIAMRIARGSSFDSSYNSYFTNVLNTENEEKAEQIANTILNYINYVDLLLLSSYFNNDKLFRQIILKIFNKNYLYESDNIIALIEKYSEIKSSLGLNDNSLLKELNKWEIDKEKLDVNNLTDDFIEDCISNPDLKISQAFFNIFNEKFKNLDKKDCETVFGYNSTDIHFRYFKNIELSNLTQQSLDVFENKFIEILEQGDEIEQQRWDILNIYDSNNSNLSVVNTFKNILGRILNEKIDLQVDLANRLIPYFIKYNLLSGCKDIFRLIIKNDFLSDSDFINLLIKEIECIKALYKNAGEEKDNFRNLLNEKREGNAEIEKLAKALNIKKPKSE